MKVPLQPERNRPPTQNFTLPTIGSYGSASTLPMTDEEMEAAKKKKKRLGFV